MQEGTWAAVIPTWFDNSKKLSFFFHGVGGGDGGVGLLPGLQYKYFQKINTNL